MESSIEGPTIICELIEGRLPSVDDIAAKIVTPECGAISTFQGVTRNNFNGKEVTFLSYECYQKMALHQLNQICKELCEKHGDQHMAGIAIFHRLGEVPIGEASVIIVSASAHRVAAISATAECIDLLKKRVPIWKKEFYAEPSESPSWKQNPEYNQLLDESNQS